MAQLDRYEPLNLDHSSIIEAKGCFRRYFYKIVLGYIPEDKAPYFAWGSAYHKFREVLENTYGFGADLPKQFDEDKAKLAYLEGVQAGLKVWDNSDPKVGTPFDFMTTARLLKSFVKAYEHWKLEKQQGRVIVLATEQIFNIQLPDGRFISGKADQIVKWNGKTWGRDFKTTSKDENFYARSIDPNNQFTLYTYAESQLSGTTVNGQLVEVLFNKKPTKSEPNGGGPKIYTLTASRSPVQLQEWERDIQVFNRLIDLCRETDTWPMCEVSCSFCPYHIVCTMPSETAKIVQLKNKFKLRPWDNAHVDD